MSDFTIPYDDFGGDGPLLHFSHPNAYAPRTFRQFLEPLTADFHVIAAHHWPLWYRAPGYDPAVELVENGAVNWDRTADDLLRFFDQQKLDAVIGVGHSLGAVVTMLAARKEPERFRALVLIEPVFLPPAVLEQAVANPDAATKTPLVESALRRRDHWVNRQAAYEHFRGKTVFGRWSDEALWDFIEGSMIHDPTTGEVTLSYPKASEALIYSRPPTHVWDVLRDMTTQMRAIPTLAVRAAESDTLFPSEWLRWQSIRPETSYVELENVGHMLTMEAPQDTAAIVGHWLADQGLVESTTNH